MSKTQDSTTTAANMINALGISEAYFYAMINVNNYKVNFSDELLEFWVEVAETIKKINNGISNR